MGFVITQRRCACGVGKEQTFRRGRHWGWGMYETSVLAAWWMVKTSEVPCPSASRGNAAERLTSFYRPSPENGASCPSTVPWRAGTGGSASSPQLPGCGPGFVGFVPISLGGFAVNRFGVWEVHSKPRLQHKTIAILLFFNNIFYTSVVVSLLLFRNINE